MKLSASEAASIAAKKNPTVEVARLAMQAGQAGVYEEEARFGRTLGLSLSHRMDREPSVSSLEQVTTSSTNFQSLGLGLTQRLGTGGKVELTVRQNRSASNAGYRTVNPVFGTDMELALTQPLLRGRGKVNRAALNIARNDLEIAGRAQRMVKLRDGLIEQDSRCAA